MSKPKLPLTQMEKRRLRKAKIKIDEIHTLSVERLKTILEVPAERARMIRALAEFQTIPSIGYCRNSCPEAKNLFDKRDKGPRPS